MRILILFAVIFTVNLINIKTCNSSEINRNKTSDEALLIDNLGKEIDKCRNDFPITEYQCNNIQNIFKCHDKEIAKNTSLTACYIKIAEKIAIDFYPKSRKKMIESINESIKSNYQTNIFTYTYSNFCNPTCGQDASYLAAKATNYDLQEYLLRTLDYLYTQAKNQ